MKILLSLRLKLAYKMNILKTIKERRSVRRFLSNSIPKEIQDALKVAIDYRELLFYPT